MKIELSPEEKKTLRLFSLYIQSHSLTKKSTISIYYDGDGNFDYQDTMYADKGNVEISLYPKVEKLIDKIINQIDWDYFTEGYDEINQVRIDLEFDTTDNTIEICFWLRINDVQYYSSEDWIPESAKNIVDTLSDKCDIVEIDFSGGGDSGYIEDVISCNNRTFNNLITQEFGDFLYNMLSEYGGWEINEGSQGKFEINFKDNVVILQIGLNSEDDMKSEKRIVINF
jgi:hypothetical protein